MEFRNEIPVQFQLEKVLPLTPFPRFFWARGFQGFFNQKFFILVEIWEVRTEITTKFLGICEELAEHGDRLPTETVESPQRLTTDGTEQPSVSLKLAPLWAGGRSRWPPDLTSDVLWFCKSTLPFSLVVSRTKSAKVLVFRYCNHAALKTWRRTAAYEGLRCLVCQMWEI